MKFYSPDSQTILGPALLLPQEGSGSGGSKRPMNSFAILRDDHSVLVDAAFSWTVEGIRKLVADGRPPRALVLSHGDVVGSADALGDIAAEFGIPVMLHPLDAARDEASATGIEFVDPIHSDLLDASNVVRMHVPGHTPGSTMLWIEDEGGILFTGDCAVGLGPEQGAPDAEPTLQRPTMSDERRVEFVQSWHRAVASHPVAAILPLHGQCLLQADVGEAVFATLQANVAVGEAMDPRSP